jgi:inward rectifier potassium channel
MASTNPEYEIRVVGAPRTPLRDFYHGMLRLSWPVTVATIAIAYLLLNALFACGYVATGGIDHARPGSWPDAFFFSVQTMGTIGYGAMAPVTTAANVLVVVESVLSLVFMAMATGLVFAKFSRPTARVRFTNEATISKVNGVPTLAFRVGNMRSNQIVNARVHMAVTRTEVTSEGKIFYRTVDLAPLRANIFTLARSWTVQHIIDAQSPLWGETAETMMNKDAEIVIVITGIDDLWMQAVHAQHRYLHNRLAWGRRHVDVLSEENDVVTLDLRKFHDTEPAA